MILPIVVIVVIVLAFGVPGMLTALRDRSRRRQRRSSPVSPGWWPQFEREFRAYVRELEHDGQRGDAPRPHSE
jgi:hypothetical protein